jgi:hypothetical protein
MKYFKTTGILLLSVIMLACCKTQQFPPTNEKAKQLKNQQKILDAAKSQVKDNWVNLVHSYSNWDWFKKAYNENLSDADIPSMSMVAIPVYRMDSTLFYNFTSNADIVNNLMIDSKNALFLIREDTSFVVAIESKYTGCQWSGGGYSGIIRGIAKKYYHLYSQGISFYNLYVYPYQTNSPFIFAFYNNSKELMSIHPDGSEVPLTDELNQERNALKEWYKIHKK